MTDMLSLSELIAKYGDDKVTFQKIDDCATYIQMTKKGSRATFVTPEPCDFRGFIKLGLVVWLDRERVAEIVAAERQAATP
jgi:hypothetical protein